MVYVYVYYVMSVVEVQNVKLWKRYINQIIKDIMENEKNSVVNERVNEQGKEEKEMIMKECVVW